MDLEFQPTELEIKRKAMWAERHKPGMSLTQLLELSSEIRRQYPPTNEERLQKARSREGIPEFIL
jgi:hypothetical protein